MFCLHLLTPLSLHFAIKPQDEAGWTGLYRQHALMIWNTCPYTDLRLIANVSKMKTPKPTRKFKQKDSGEPLGAEEEEVERISRLSSSTRNQVLHHASAMSRVVGFLMHLQETRSSKRTKDIKPKVTAPSSIHEFNQNYVLMII